MNEKPVRILIADDHAMVRSAISTWIQTIPDLDLIGQAVNGEEAVAQTLALKPDIVLMDLMMPKMDGIAATQSILKSNPAARILIVTSFTEKQRAVKAIQAGAQGFILKDASLEDLLEAIRTVHKGRPWFSLELARALAAEKDSLVSEAREVKIDDLTERELDVLRLLVHGLSDQEIAAELVISHSTVRFHIHQILEKVHVQNRTQASLLAIRKGWVKI
jgi:two-component system, NarL family, response regulator LiaR